LRNEKDFEQDIIVDSESEEAVLSKSDSGYNEGTVSCGSNVSGRQVRV
jgi:hypothetical protein